MIKMGWRFWRLWKKHPKHPLQSTKPHAPTRPATVTKEGILRSIKVQSGRITSPIVEAMIKLGAEARHEILAGFNELQREEYWPIRRDLHEKEMQVEEQEKK